MPEAEEEKALRERWEGILRVLRTDRGGAEAGGDGCNSRVSAGSLRQCAVLASQLQRTAVELITVARAARLGEEKLKRIVCEQLFGLCSNPQDGEVVAEDPVPTTHPAIWVVECSDAPKAQGGDRSETQGSLAVRELEDQKRGTFCSSKGMIKHLEGCPSQLYKLDDTKVGEGSFGTVVKAEHLQTGQVHAVKTVPKAKVEADQLWAEIEIMKLLDHPHIMRLYYTFEGADNICIVSELCSGGEFFDVIERHGYLPECSSRRIFKQILSGVNYLHGKYICHRDLKPENFLVSKKLENLDDLHLKLIDFGTAKDFGKGQMVTKVCTPHYVAPEVLKRSCDPYSEKVDVWSCGVILYMMLSGLMPFHHENNQTLMKLVKKGKFEFTPQSIWKLISDDAKDLIKSMVNVKPAERLSSMQAYQHPAMELDFAGASSGAFTLDEKKLMDQMTQFVMHDRLKKVSLQIMARQVEDGAIARLREIFLEIDEDFSGSLSLDEMDLALRKLDVPNSVREDMRGIVKSLAQDNNNEIEYSEFLAMTITPEHYLRVDVCKAAFHMLDFDGDGIMSREDLHCILGDKGKALEVGLSPTTMSEINHIMGQLDENGDGGVDFDEFMGFMADNAPPTAIRLRSRRNANKERHQVLDLGGVDEEDEDDDESDGDGEGADGDDGEADAKDKDKDKEDGKDS